MRRSGFYRTRIARGAIELLAIAVLSPLASRLNAADVNWINPTGGDFTDGMNWSGGNSPGLADDAVFNLGSAGYTVNIPDGDQVSTSQILVETDQVTLNLASNGTDFTSYNLTAANDSLVVGENAGDDSR